MSLALALLYREVAILKRRFPEVVTMWTFSILFSLSVIYGPSMFLNTEVEYVLKRLSILFGKTLSFNEALLLMLTLSAAISLTSIVMSELSQQVINDKLTGAIEHVLLGTSLTRYYLTYSIVSSIVIAPVSTAYLVPLMILIEGVNGLVTYMYLLPMFLISCIALMLYASIIMVPVSYLTKFQKLWIIPSLLVPMLLAGSGVFIPLAVVPIFLRILAYTSPLPETCEILQEVLLNVPSKAALPIVLLAIMFTLYLVVSSGVVRLTESRSRKQGLALV